MARVRKWDLNQVDWRFLNEVIRPIRQLGNLPMGRLGKVGAKPMDKVEARARSGQICIQDEIRVQHTKRYKGSPVIGMAWGDLPMWPMLSFVETWQGHQIILPPQSEVVPRSFHQHSRELELGGFYPLIGGISGRDNMNLVSWSLNCSRSWMTFRW